MRTVRTLAGCLLALSGAACSNETGSVSTNPGEPTVLDASAVNILGTAESIATVKDIEVLPNGSVWVLNSVEPLFVGFNPDGDVIAEQGTLGGGPTEFALPAAFIPGGIDDEAWVLDIRRHGLIRVSAPDSEWREMTLPRDAIPPASLLGGMSLLGTTVRTERLNREVLVPRTTGSREEGFLAYRMAMLAPDLIAVDVDTQSSREVVALADVLGDLTQGLELTEGGFPLWYRLWAVCGGTEIRVLDRAENTVRGFDRDGLELPPVALPPVAFTEVTPRQFATAVYALRAAEVSGSVGTRLTAEDSLRLINEGVNSVTGTPAQLAAYLPRYVDLRCTAEGVLWMQPIDLERGGLLGGPAWIRIEPDGETREVQLPSGFDAFRFGRDRIWGVQRDDLDVASIAWIDMAGAF